MVAQLVISAGISGTYSNPEEPELIGIVSSELDVLKAGCLAKNFGFVKFKKTILQFAAVELENTACTDGDFFVIQVKFTPNVKDCVLVRLVAWILGVWIDD